MVCNYNPYTTPQVKAIDFKFGQISDPYEIVRVAPVHSIGEGSYSQRIQTWGNPGKPISEMSPNSLQSQEERAKHYNTLNAIMVRPGKPLAKGSLSSYKQKDLERVPGELVSIWGKSKRSTCLPKNRERERFFPRITMKWGGIAC